MTAALRLVTVCAAVITLAVWAAPPPAAAFNPVGTACSIGGLFSGLIGKACTLATHAGRIIGAGKKLLGGHVGGAVKVLSGTSAVTKAAAATVGLATIEAATRDGARYLLSLTARLIDATTTPQLRSTWFSASYWRMAGIATLLTLPFLFAAAIQAIVRGDVSMLLRAAFGYLPLAMLAIGIAAPLTMLLLAASDEMSALIAAASGQAPAVFLSHAARGAGIASAVSSSLFPSFVAAVFTVVATIALWVELLTRQSAVYVIVLMLPLFFAALVWPARRAWAVRAVEVLVALILSKFAIVAVLSLGGAALGHAAWGGLTAMIAGASLVMLACFSPWALMRLLPLHDLAGAAAGGLRSSARVLPGVEAGAGVLADVAEMAVAARLTSVSDGSTADPSRAAAAPTRGHARSQPASAVADVSVAPPGADGGAVAPQAEAAHLPVAGSASGPPPVTDDEPQATPSAGERRPGMGPLFQHADGGWGVVDVAGAGFGRPIPGPEPSSPPPAEPAVITPEPPPAPGEPPPAPAGPPAAPPERLPIRDDARRPAPSDEDPGDA